jgi:ribosomal protein L37AE/L43A
LERVVKPPNACDACGYEYMAPVRTRLTFAEAPNDGPDACPKCGRPLLVRIAIEVVRSKDEGAAT